MEKRPDNIVPQKSDNEEMLKDVKSAAQSGDNDGDRIPTVPDEEAKKATDKAYLENKRNDTEESE